LLLTNIYEYVPYLSLSGRRVKRLGVGPRFQIRMLFYQFSVSRGGCHIVNEAKKLVLAAARQQDVCASHWRHGKIDRD
jgi:hypothetical protein